MYTKEAVKKVFRELDLNGDGKITADEFSKKEVDAAVEADACQQSQQVQSLCLELQVVRFEQALGKLAMDRFFEFQHDRSPGDTDLAAIDKVFERRGVVTESLWLWESVSLAKSGGCPRLDADQDELLSLPEFNAGARNREVKASDLFQSIDSDGNGYLDAAWSLRAESRRRRVA